MADAVTAAENVQVAPAANEPPVKPNTPAPAVAVTVPPHVVAPPGVEKIVTPAGSASLKARADSATALVPVLAIVTVKVDDPLTGIVAGENALLTTTGGTIVNVAVAALLFVEPWSVATVLAGIVLT